MRYYLIFLFSLLATVAQAASVFVLNEVEIVCEASELCNQKKNRFENLVGEYRSLLHFKETLKILANDGGYQSFSYELIKDNNIQKLKLHFKIKPVIKEIDVGYTDRSINVDPIQLLTVKEGEYFEESKLRESIENLSKKLELIGFPYSTHVLALTEKNNNVAISIAITLGKPRLFKKLETNTDSPFITKFLHDKFVVYYNQPFEFNKFKLYLDEAQKELFSYGYYLIALDFSPVIKNDRVTLNVKVTNDQLFAFDFRNLQQESRDVLHGIVTELFRKYKRPLTESVLRQGIKEHYLKKAHLNVDIKIELSEFKNKFGEPIHLYRITLDEKYKTKMVDLSFSGNVFYSQKKLHKYFYKDAFELASIQYYDSEYLDYFHDFLKEKYIKNGFVQIKIQEPLKIFDQEKKSVSVEYIIQEGLRTFTRSVEFSGLPEGLESTVIKEMENKENQPFNPIALVDDVKKVATLLQERGYYFAEVTNANDDSLVKYSRSGADVFIKFDINAGPIVKLNRVIFLGNNLTKKKVIQKKVLLKNGDLVTPSKTREIEAALSATGLFNSVTVEPQRHSSKKATTDLIVKVSERDYGLVEFAPGFRTDLGIKLTGTASYLNIGGNNLSITLRSQLNQRVNNQTLDTKRKEQNLRFLEHNESLTFNKGDVYDTNINSATSFSYQRKRFYSFDADIARGNQTFTRDLTQHLSSSIRYQLENIIQTNALTTPSDNGAFRIGAITPTLTMDYRNSVVIPRKGAFFNLSTEFANPFFLSQKTEDLTINYYKFMSRNRFYIPFKNGTVALSMVGGVEQNLATDERTDSTGKTTTEGYIPNIKVFRLTGMDIIRGFTDQEANKVPVGNTEKDISEVQINNRAYLVNLKLEPRYFVNDNLIAGVFYDAGRVFVNSLDLTDLRDSVGVSFKIRTPVGTLDFDYGIKLLRKRIQMVA